MDREFEAYMDDEFLDNLPTLFPIDSPHAGSHDMNLMENFNFETLLESQNIEEPIFQLEVALTPTVMESFVETQTQVQTTQPMSYQGSPIACDQKSAMAPTPLVQTLPNSSASLFQETQSNHPLQSAEGLPSEGAGPSIQGYDINQFSSMENENLLAFQGISFFDNQNPSNPQVVPNIIGNDNFNGINNQSSSYPELFHPNPAWPDIETGYSSGQFVTPQSPAFLPLHNNQISNSSAAWNSRPERSQFSAPDLYGAQYALNYTDSPQPFTTMQNQVGHASEMLQIFDLQSQNAMQPVYSTHPRSELHSNLQSAFVTMPLNPYQQGYRHVVPEPAASSASSLANYSQQPSLFATTNNSFGSGSSVPPTYPPLYENQDPHHPQVMKPSVQQSGASVQQWPEGVPNQRSLQAMSSRILDHLRTRMIEGTSPQVPNSREVEIAPDSSSSRVQQVATSANEVPAHNKGKVPRSSSTRTKPSEAIRRILNMNPSRMVTHNALVPGQQNQKATTDLGNQLLSLREGRYGPQYLDRSPKRRDVEESSSPRGKLQKVSLETGKVGTTTTSQQTQRSPDSVVNRDQNAIPANSPAAPRHYLSTVYDMEFERNGVPVDPHLRFFKPPPED